VHVIQKRLKYAGIGPRLTPIDICLGLTDIAKQLDSRGWLLRSGYAQGADQAWQCGTQRDRMEIYLPWQGFNQGHGTGFMVSPITPAIEAAARLSHPAWNRLSQAGQKLMMRNVSIILGHNLDDPVEFVAYWSSERKVQGGTGNALRLAQMYGIPSFNVAFEDDQQRMSTFVDLYHKEGV
jgi:hypothetical protein